jgi:hypothetical protein
LVQKPYHKNISKPNKPLPKDLILTRLGRPENIDSTIDKTKNQGLTQKLNQNKDLNQNKMKTKKTQKP